MMLPPSMKYLLGIDGGGTRTTACLADEHAKVLARVQTGPSNPLKVGWADAQQELLRALRQSCRQAHIRPKRMEAVCIGLAGTSSPTARQRLLRWLRKAVPARAYILTTDADLALAAAVGTEPGIVVIAGTGSIAYGRDPQGRMMYCGGWGSLFDDAGSGYDLGRKAVRSALRHLDGRGKATGLTASLRREFGLDNLRDAVTLPFAPQDVAALFPILLREAERGDAVARQLCHQAGGDLADLALALVKRFGWKRQAVRIYCAGGIFRASLLVLRSFARKVRSGAPNAQISLLRREPVEGALYLALQATLLPSEIHQGT